MVCRSLLLLIAVLGCSQAYAQTGAGTGTGTAPPKDKLAKVSVKVIDESGGAIGDAEAEVLNWTGKYESTGAKGKADKDGRVTLDAISLGEGYPYLKVKAEGYATSLKALLDLSAGESADVTFKLSSMLK